MSDADISFSERVRPVEDQFIAQCRDWSLSIGAWSVKAAELRKEREQLDDLMVSFSASTVVMLMKNGMTMPAAEARVETLMEKAFTR